MRKLVCVLAAMLILFALPSSIAEPASKQAMVFDIPWLCNTDEVLRLLVDMGYISSIDSVFIVENAGQDYILNEQAELTSVGNYSAVMSTISLVNQFEITNVKLAGYLIDSIGLNFAYDGEESKLISANVRLEAPSGYNVLDDVLPDMLDKLGRLYSLSKETVGEYHREYVYSGASRTAVVVGYSSWSESSLTLIYGNLDAIPVLDSCLSAARDAQGLPSPNDLGGL